MRSREQKLAEVSKWLEAYAWLEEELGERADFRFGRARPSSDGTGPDAVAQAARDAVGVAPEGGCVGHCGLRDRGGAKLLLMETTRGSFFGLRVDEPDGGPTVVVNTWERTSVERWIFTAARGLGHLLLHPHEYGAKRRTSPKRLSGRRTSSPASS